MAARRRWTRGGGAGAGLALGALCTLASAQSLSTDYMAAPAGRYQLDPVHTAVILRVSHLGLASAVIRVKGVSGTLDFDPAHVEASRLDIQMDAASLDAGDPAADRALSTDVLDAARYPAIRFVSTAVKPSMEGQGRVVGDLSLHGQTHPVTLDVIFNGFAADPKNHGVRMGFTAQGALRRSDYGAVALSPAVGDEVSVSIEAEFAR